MSDETELAWNLMVKTMSEGPAHYIASRIEAIAERLQAANPGPWEHVTGSDKAMNLMVTHCGTTDDGEEHIVALTSSHETNGATAKDDAEFIAHAPADVAYLVKLVQQLQAEKLA